MGIIRVGKDNPRLFDGGALGIGSTRPVFSDEEKAKLLASIKQMPKEDWVSAMRSAGLDDEANDLERTLAEEHIRELNDRERSKRLEEIMQMPEEDQLSLLVAEGYEDAARELSEQLSRTAGSEKEEAKPRRRGRKPKQNK